MSRKTIENFNPGVEVIGPQHQDLLFKFDAGSEFKNFNDFLREEATIYLENGDGVTYLVLDNFCGDEPKVIAYFTLSGTSIPYRDRYRNYEPEEEVPEGEEEFDEKMCGISAVEIKMFAVDKDFQDLFYCNDGVEKPISALILEMIIGMANDMSSQIIGIKSIFLHATENAEDFYRKSQFRKIEPNMIPLHTVDDDFQAMYLPLREIKMHYDE